MQKKNLGFDKDNIVMVPLPDWETNKLDLKQKALLSNELSAIPQVSGWTYSSSPPSGSKEAHWGTMMSTKGQGDPSQKGVTMILTDDQFCSLYSMNLKAGRFFTIADTSAVSQSLPEGQRFPKAVVNEKLIQELGFASPQAALGKKFWIGMNGWNPEIIGVVSDFNISSLHDAIRPTMITQYLGYCNNLSIKIKAGSDMPSTIAKINQAYKNAFTSGIFEFNFLDQQLDALYKADQRLYGLFKIFSALAMLISCLGLWGLITFAAQQRVKEIGIRKVLGASVISIVSMLTKDFIILIGISIAIATPLAYWGIYKWLQDFAFRINIGWSMFVIAGIIAVMIASLTVSFQAIKAAVANPVKSLRTE